MITDARRLLGVSNYGPTPQQVSLAKVWIRKTLAGHIDHDTIFDISLCVVELVDNARKHGPAGGLINVVVYMSIDTVRVEVTDGGSPETVPYVADHLLTENGHGLKIVSEVAEHWGTHQNPDLKRVVWCEFRRKDERK